MILANCLVTKAVVFLVFPSLWNFLSLKIRNSCDYLSCGETGTFYESFAFFKTKFLSDVLKQEV